MSLILSIDTSTPICSVALHKEGQIVAHQQLHSAKSHSSYITVMIETLTSQSGYTLNDIDAFAIGYGPGSFTGLRIGVSTIKGYCYALNKPAIAINSLESMAKTIAMMGYENTILCPMTDARRMEVYCMLIKNDEILEPTHNLIVDENSFQDILEDHKIVFFGDGASKCKSYITSENAQFIDHINPNALGVGILAYEAFQRQQFEDVAYFEPFYLKDFHTKPSTKKLL